MKKKIVILILVLSFCMIPFGRAQMTQHYFALWGELASAMMLTSSDVATPSFGFGGGVGLGYEMQYEHFLLQTGLHINGAQENFRLRDGKYALRTSTDSEGYIFDFWYKQENRIDKYSLASVQIPLLLGGEFNRFYFLAGAKVNIHLFAKAHASGIYSSLGDYDPMIDEFEDMPNHQFFSDYNAVSDENYSFKHDVLLSGEFGLRLGNLYRASADSKVRLAIYLDYGLLDCHTAGDKELVSLAQTFNAGDMKTSVQPHNYLSTKAAINPAHSLQVGIKLTYLLSGKSSKSRYCPMCNDNFVPRKHKKKCVICKFY